MAKKVGENKIICFRLPAVVILALEQYKIQIGEESMSKVLRSLLAIGLDTVLNPDTKKDS